MSRPSRTNRLPPAIESPNSGTIQESGVGRSARCAAAGSAARVVFPAAGSPTIRNSVATDGCGTGSPCGGRDRDTTLLTRAGRIGGGDDAGSAAQRRASTAAIRATISVSTGSGVARSMRTEPRPAAPHRAPSTTATPARSSSSPGASAGRPSSQAR